jgi:hypothetical protein
MLPTALISLVSLVFACSGNAQANTPTVAGIGRNFGYADLFRDAVVSVGKLVSSVDSIVASLTEGYNRTNSCVLPVDKVYGVNVRS